MGQERRAVELDQDIAKETVRGALADTHLTLDELSAAYADAGGELSGDELRAAIAGTRYLGAVDYNVIVTALNEMLVNHWISAYVPYADELPVVHRRRRPPAAWSASHGRLLAICRYPGDRPVSGHPAR